MTENPENPRLAVDIGGTFTDVVLEAGGGRFTRKVLTTHAPEDGVMEAIAAVLEESGVSPEALSLVLHGTTLATNAIIERKGARTALIVTEGFRDSVEMAYENRFEQYDINVERPAPLVPRYLRWPVLERMTARGVADTALDETTVEALVPELDRHGIESIAVGLLHSYANPAHEKRVGEILRAARPDLSVTLSSEVCPEIREYERLSTACANAYVQPLMARYLTRLDERLRARGVVCPLLMLMSSGGLTTLETAVRFPIRLVDSGPAGGAILASHIARECDLARVLSFDMGGTTAKICLIDDGQPRTSRSFEVARAYRFTKGSGLPLRIPVIEMVEIGAGGGSIASVDALGRINVGPQSAGAEPGPACYGRGGAAATVTDANVVLGRIDPARFAGGAIPLDSGKARAALADAVGEPLAMDPTTSGFAVSEVVDENMANAARVHAVERGMELSGRALIAFGGAAPLHAARLARKLGIARIVVPTEAGVGSAIGFLRAPVAYEVVRSRYMRLSAPDIGAANRLLAEMRAEAEGVVRLGAPDAELAETRAASMRYVGQGHEIDVAIPERLTEADAPALKQAFDDTYRAHYGRTIPDVDVEVLNWMLTVSTSPAPPGRANEPALAEPPAPRGRRAAFDPDAGDFVDMPVYGRADLAPGARIHGPALIVEDQTTTVVASGFDAHVNGLGYIVMVYGDMEREAS